MLNVPVWHYAGSYMVSLALTLGLSVCLSLRYHTGTLAFGSLILSIVQIIRVLLEYIDHKLKGLFSLLPSRDLHVYIVLS